MAFGIKRPNTGTKIRIPGGVTIRPTATNIQPSSFEVAMQLMTIVNAIFAPIQPILTLIRFGQAVVKFVEALSDVIGVPPNLGKLQSATDELIEAGASVLALNPSVAMVVFVTDVIDAARLLLDGMDEQLAQIEQVQSAADAIRANADQEFVTVAVKLQMNEDADELDEVADTLASSLSDVLEPVTLLFEVINVIGSIVGTNAIPTIDVFEGVNAARTAIDKFRAALDLIPV